jgi:hypothetical protein
MIELAAPRPRSRPAEAGARDPLQERLAKLAGGAAVIKVGAATETEMKEKRHALRTGGGGGGDRPRGWCRAAPRREGSRHPASGAVWCRYRSRCVDRRRRPTGTWKRTSRLTAASELRSGAEEFSLGSRARSGAIGTLSGSVTDRRSGWTGRAAGSCRLRVRSGGASSGSVRLTLSSSCRRSNLSARQAAGCLDSMGGGIALRAQTERRRRARPWHPGLVRLLDR